MPTSPTSRPFVPRLFRIGISWLLAGCGANGVREDEVPGAQVVPQAGGGAAGHGADAAGGAKDPEAEVPPAPAEAAPPAAGRVGGLPAADRLSGAVASWFDGRVGRRVHVQVDKPLYEPGETIWIRTWDLRVRDLGGGPVAGITYELVSPKGAVVLRKRVQQDGGAATNDFGIPAEARGGEYIVRARTDDGVTADRAVVVRGYEAPRFKKKLEFVRKAYGVGDEVAATVEVSRPTGEPFAGRPLTAVVVLDGGELARVPATTDAFGAALVRFTLPARIERGDGLLTVLVADGGVTESVSKRVPIVLDRLQVSLFPEGGGLVSGLESRVFLDVQDLLGKPADAAGRVVDDHGALVAQWETYDRGLGRFTFTPATGRTYRAEVTRPAGISEAFALPLAADDGCVLRTYDDPDGAEPALRARVACTQARKVVVAAVLRERLVDAAAVEVPGRQGAVVALGAQGDLARAAGVARITVFDESLAPLAERLVFRNRRALLRIDIEPDAAAYTPREQVALKVRTTDPSGAAVPAEVALAVVDDTVIAYADDKKGHMLARLLLEPELPGEIEEPNFYFDLTEERSGLGLELLMGVRGWRRFEWREVFAPPPAPDVDTRAMAGSGGGRQRERAIPMEGEEEGEFDAPFDGAEAPAALPAPMAPPPPEGIAEARPMAGEEALAMEAQDKAGRAAPKANDDGGAFAADELEDAGPARVEVLAEKKAEEVAGPLAARRRKPSPHPPAPAGWAPVRVFPAPDYAGPQEGPRTDFRQTVHWAPRVRTDKGGKATVTFYLSDAVTSFRVVAEGVGGGHAGRREKVVSSRLPFSLSAKLPVAVSEGDVLELPVTLTNEQDQALPVSVAASFGDLVRLDRPVTVPGGQLPAGGRATLFYNLTVTGREGLSDVKLSAAAGGLTDEVERRLAVTPRGFPQLAQASGALTQAATHVFDLAGALPGTARTTIKLYPSPVSTLTTGLDGLLREPYGCFEQTSSSNYPNVMVLKYLQSNEVAAPDLVRRTRDLLDKGYERLVGFETKQRGYEWFGGVPAHEALTAYGLLEFADMAKVWGGVDRSMMARTADWLRKRRDGKGGFQRDGKALDSFGRASPEVTDAYIVYAVAAAGLADDFTAELDAQRALADALKDPYRLALAANALLLVARTRPAGLAAAGRLAAMQRPEGHWTGAAHSITRSTGPNLDVETTSLALLALMEAGGRPEQVRRGVGWLNDHRGGYGAWGATQATVLALQALSEYATRYRATRSPGTIQLLLNGQVVATVGYEAGRRDPIELPDVGSQLTAGTNTLELRSAGGDELPYTVAVEHRSLKPASHPDVAVSLATRLDRDRAPMGETLRMTATLANRTAEGQPMTLARLGVPGGLDFQTWQLEELKDKGVIAFWESRPQEVIVYLRDMAPSAVVEIPLDLVAAVPGTYTGPASQAYLYYTNDRRAWTDGVRATVTR